VSVEHDKKIAAQRARENQDPDEGIKPLPWFLVMSLGAMAMWGAFYIYTTPSGEDSAYGDQRTVSTLRPPEAAPAGATGGVAKVDGKLLYVAKCAACHQATGLGLAGVFPPLAGAEWVLGDEKILTNILLHGVNGALEVKGVQYTGVMPAWKSLSDDELAAVLTYIRSDWGNAAAAIKPDTIKTQREATKARTEPYNGGQALLAGP
jgi:mono/diheme cytochrome c family protein